MVQPQSHAGGFFAYVSNSGDGSIVVLSVTSAMDAPHVLQTIKIAPDIDAKGGMSTPMAIAPDGRHLYAAVRLPPLPVSSFSIDRSSGQLSAIGTARLPASTPYILADRTGRFLFSSANPGSTLAVNGIGADGSVEARARQVLHIDHKLHSIAVSPDNRHVYVSSTDDETLHQFALDARSGALKPLDPPFLKLSKGVDPRHLAVSPDGRFLYATTEAGGGVLCCSVDIASGRLTERSTIEMMPDSFSGKALTADLRLTPDGGFLYASERLMHRIVAFRVDRDSGTLTLAGETESEKTPRAFAIAPNGKFMLVAGQDTGKLCAYAIDGESGRLDKGFAIDIGPKPNWIEIVSG